MTHKRVHTLIPEAKHGTHIHWEEGSPIFTMEDPDAHALAFDVKEIPDLIAGLQEIHKIIKEKAKVSGQNADKGCDSDAEECAQCIYERGYQ